MADFLHGPKLIAGKKKKKTYLHVILDDSSRFIVHGGFYLTESVEPLINDLMGAVRRFGIPQHFYTDNGAAYSSRHLKIICARNGIDLVHTPPYRPQGRGKVERINVKSEIMVSKPRQQAPLPGFNNDRLSIITIDFQGILRESLRV